MTTTALEARLRGALAEPVSTDRLRETLEGLIPTDTSAIARFERDPLTGRATLVEIAALGESPCLLLHPSYTADGMLQTVFIQDVS